MGGLTPLNAGKKLTSECNNDNDAETMIAAQ